MNTIQGVYQKQAIITQQEPSKNESLGKLASEVTADTTNTSTLVETNIDLTNQLEVSLVQNTKLLNIIKVIGCKQNIHTNSNTKQDT